MSGMWCTRMVPWVYNAMNKWMVRKTTITKDLRLEKWKMITLNWYSKRRAIMKYPRLQFYIQFIIIVFISIVVLMLSCDQWLCVYYYCCFDVMTTLIRMVAGKRTTSGQMCATKHNLLHQPSQKSWKAGNQTPMGKLLPWCKQSIACNKTWCKTWCKTAKFDANNQTRHKITNSS